MPAEQREKSDWGTVDLQLIAYHSLNDDKHHLPIFGIYFFTAVIALRHGLLGISLLLVIAIGPVRIAEPRTNQ